MSARLNQKEVVDAEQTRRLKDLQSLLNQKKSVDDEQQRAIQILFEFIKQKDQLDKEQSNSIQELFKWTQAGKLALTFSIVSLLASAGLIAWGFLR